MKWNGLGWVVCVLSVLGILFIIINTGDFEERCTIRTYLPESNRLFLLVYV